MKNAAIRKNTTILKTKMVKFLLTLVSAVLIMAFVSSCSSDDGDDGETLFDKILDGETIDVLFVDYSPYVNVENGRIVGGFNVELVQEIARRQNLNVNFQLIDSYTAGIEAIQNGEADLFGGPTWPASERAAKVAFTNPYAYTEVYAYKNVNDTIHQSLNDIGRETRIAFVEGQYFEHYINSSFSSAEQLPLPSASLQIEAALKVADREADVVIIEKSVFEESFTDLPLEELDPAFTIGVRLFHPHGEYDFHNAINLSIDELVEIDFVDTLIAKYFPSCAGCIVAPR